jgi:hypothetical protein
LNDLIRVSFLPIAQEESVVHKLMGY